MIEKVRSIAIGLFFKEENAGELIAAAYSEGALARQAATTARVMERQPCASAPAALERAKNIGLAHLSAALFLAARFCARFIRAPLNPTAGSPD
jgi:hypothetical protein